MRLGIKSRVGMTGAQRDTDRSTRTVRTTMIDSSIINTTIIPSSGETWSVLAGGAGSGQKGDR